jgi:hypothetical protein
MVLPERADMLKGRPSVSFPLCCPFWLWLPLLGVAAEAWGSEGDEKGESLRFG